MFMNKYIVIQNIIIMPKGESTDEATNSGVLNGKIMYKIKTTSVAISNGGMDCREFTKFMI